MYYTSTNTVTAMPHIDFPIVIQALHSLSSGICGGDGSHAPKHAPEGDSTWRETIRVVVVIVSVRHESRLTRRTSLAIRLCNT